MPDNHFETLMGPITIERLVQTDPFQIWVWEYRIWKSDVTGWLSPLP